MIASFPKSMIGGNCRIGSHTVVMPGVTIGENAVVGAMSFVNCDIPDDCVAVGVPAKVIETIQSADYAD
jgi:acetyltransferase-like isoleucine patch superfamily enzyme